MTTETVRRASNREKVLQVLQDHKNVTNLQLNEICFRYGARILELRAQGYDIRTGPNRGGVVTYTFHGLKTSGQQALFGDAA